MAHMLEDVAETLLMEIELIALAFVTGIQDATTFADFHCFASNQTGNSVMLAVSVAGLDNGAFSLSNVGMSLGMFVAGTLLYGQLGNLCGPRRRAWLIFANLFQSILIFIVSAMQLYRPPEEWGLLELGEIALLAFASGGQVAVVRGLHVTDITTAMATAAYIDIFIDAKLMSVHNRPRNRRILFLVSLVGGSFAGAFLRAKISSGIAVLASAIGKVFVCVLFLFNQSQ